jgi:AIPR protein
MAVAGAKTTWKVGRMALVALFKEQLENESRAIAESRGLEKRGDFLTWWYFLKLPGLRPEEIEEIVCDGFNDLGIDAIWIDETNTVHFYSFTNPMKIADGFPSVDVDKMLAGLTLVVNRQHQKVSNESLRSLVQDVLSIVPQAYRIHLVTSGTGMSADSKAKLDAFIAGLGAPSPDFWEWQLEDIGRLQTDFYAKSLPTVEEALELSLTQQPYQVRSANHDCYIFDLSGRRLAEIYDKYSEQLLQQNIRVYQGDRATNEVIRKTAAGPESGNFFHYNNGVVFLVETAQWDGFTKKLTLRKFQVVNGGQTIRVLHQAMAAGVLRSDVSVPVRAITSQGDKDFGNNVTVNLNNQNRIEPSFLRSNDPRVVQLAAALASKGWYLERRSDEVSMLTGPERAAVEGRIGGPLVGHVIRLKDGLQAYTATFMREPELAKKNPKRIFEGAQDGGIFDRVFGLDLTAEKVITAHRLAALVNEYVRQFKVRKRRKDRVEDWRADYKSLLGAAIMKKHSAVLDQVIPQSAIFLSAIVFEEWVNIRKSALEDVLAQLEARDYSILNEKIEQIIDFAKREEETKEAKSWPTLLKSQTLFDNFASFLLGKSNA